MATGTTSVETRGSRAALVAVFLTVTVALLWWAKWAPYSVKVPSVAATHDPGESVVAATGDGAPPVSLATGLTFARSYFLAVWPALVAGLVIAAAVQVVVPRGWVGRLLRRDGFAGGAAGGVLALPTMMCTCCAAPVAVGLRRARCSVPSALAFWLANPALNPVVLVLAAFVLPWEWAGLRVAGGLAVLLGAAAVSVRWAEARDVRGREPGTDVADGPLVPLERPETRSRGPARSFVTALAGLAARFLPEYAVVVVALGAFSGVLVGTDLPGSTAAAAVAVVLLAVAGLLLPVPTAGELAVVAGLLATGASPVVAGVLLLTLPVLSLPSLLMVRSAFPASVLLRVTAVVLLAGLAAGAAATGL